MPQLIIVNTNTAQTKEQRDQLRKELQEQLPNCDAAVLVVPPGVCVQPLPQLPFVTAKPPAVSEMTVKLDAAEGLAAMRAAMQPGAVLLSPEAICSLFGLLPEVKELNGPGGLVDLLRQAGGEFSTADAQSGGRKGISPEAAAAMDRAARGMIAAGWGSNSRGVQHVDTDEPEASGLPPHVWLYRNMLTDQQLVAPLGRDETNGQYAVAIDDLTDEQRAIPHIAKQLQENNE